MKKVILSLCVLSSCSITLFAQLSQGGLPLTTLQNKNPLYIPTVTASLPDWEGGRQDIDKEKAMPYMVALFTPCDLSFPESGTMTTLEDGTRIWSTRISVPQAKALGSYFDEFYLPQGVKLFVSNESRNQVLGAYTHSNNAGSGTFAHEAVQGEIMNLEVNILPGVDVAGIRLHINKVATYFRDVEYLSRYASGGTMYPVADEIDSFANSASSVCMINAACPLGSSYQVQRQASLRVLFSTSAGVGSCSATMLNSTGNTAADCKKYVLTASHCTGGDNDTSAAYFDQTIFRFNYERSNCSDSFTVPTSNSITGAGFRARGHSSIEPAEINGDFLLLEITQPIPESWNVKLAGWNHAATIPLSETEPKRFIGFHHPAGDVKKVSSSQNIESVITVGGGQDWEVLLQQGLVARGSSGSGLFDGNGHLIGVASTAGPDGTVDPSCSINPLGGPADAFNIVSYCKFSYAWGYTAEGTNDHNMLHPWLDTDSTGVTVLAPVTASCQTFVDSSGQGGGTAAVMLEGYLNDALTIHPNPSISGRVELVANFREKTDLVVQLSDISGRMLKLYSLKGIQSGNSVFDLSAYPNGMYLMQISDGQSFVTKKIVLAR